ncbi:MAG: hypothetical protein CV089_01715 [Nitrospira sp. WS110]|nr:hypothetical protein [Nitrospira sp. WS110]
MMTNGPSITVGSRRIFRGVPGILMMLIVIMMGTWVVDVQEAHAIPAWARKYDADCAMCHYPTYPRLNSFGHQFRRAGYRTPVEFGKDQDITKIQNFLAGKVRTQVSYRDNESEVDRSQFTLNEAALMYGGAFSRNFSGFLKIGTFTGSTAGNTNNTNFTGKLYGVFGSQDNFFAVRAGQMSMLYFEGFGGLGAPTLVSLNPIYANQLTAFGATSPLRHTFSTQQRGAELSYVYGPGRFLVQVSNGLDSSGSGTNTIGDFDRRKDFLVAYEHILDEIASGFTLLYYNGTAYPSGAGGQGLNLNQRFAYERFGVNANKIFNLGGRVFLEIQGGYLRSSDRVPIQQTGGNIKGNAWYVEAQQYIPGPEVTFVQRYSVIDDNVPQKNTTRKDYTVGAVTTIQNWLRLAIEYTYTDNRATTNAAPNSIPAGNFQHLALFEVQGAW